MVSEGGREGGRERERRETKRQTDRETEHRIQRHLSLSHSSGTQQMQQQKTKKINHIIQQPPTPKPDAQDMVSQHISSSNLCQKRPISVKRGLLQNAYTRHGEPAYQLF